MLDYVVMKPITITIQLVSQPLQAFNEMIDLLN